MTNRDEILLVAGAVSNSLERYPPVKLEGSPLELTRDNKLRRFRHCDLNKVVQTIKKIFRQKPDLMRPVLGQLHSSMDHRGESTLSTTYLQRYLHTVNKDPIIVIWNGTMDVTIIKRLRLRDILAYFNKTAYSDRDNNEFNLKLINVDTKEILYTSYIGKIKKKMSYNNLLNDV